VITTALIRAIHDYDPQIQIDILCGSWSKPIFEGHSGVANVYDLDLPPLSRAQISSSEKRSIYDKGYKKLQSLFSGVHYDLVASVYAYEPSYIPVLHALLKAPIVGFSSAGYSPLLTRSYNTMNQQWHEIQHQAKVLECVLGEPSGEECYRPWLPTSTSFFIPDKAYIVIHPGSGKVNKEWNTEGWIQIIYFLHQLGLSVLITGHGKREGLLAEEIIQQLDEPQEVKNLVGKLSFNDFSTCIKHATLLVSVDSVAGHIAAAHGTPEIILSLGKTDLNRWRPLADNARVFNWHNSQKNQLSSQLVELKEAIQSLISKQKDDEVFDSEILK